MVRGSLMAGERIIYDRLEQLAILANGTFPQDSPLP